MRLSDFLPLIFTSLSVGVGAHPYHGKSGPSSWPRKHGKETAQALYTITNESPNRLIAFPVSPEGFVGEGVSYLTGGNGGVYNSSEGLVVVDPLASQDPVLVRGKIVLAVNPGSDTVTSFLIDTNNPTNLTLIGQAQLEGEFPVTIAASEILNIVCVGTAGAKNGVECFGPGENFRLKADGKGLRSFGINATTPPVATRDGISDLFFSADLNWLFATVHGDLASDRGFISAFAVANDSVSTVEIRSVPDDIELLFGGFQLPNSTNLFVSDARFGGVLLEFDGTGHFTTLAKSVAEPPILALCWAEYSNASKVAWVTSPVSNGLVAFDIHSGAQISNTNLTNPNGGLLDIAIPQPGNLLYGLASGQKLSDEAAILVVDVTSAKKPRIVQYRPIRGANSISAGLAFWPYAP